MAEVKPSGHADLAKLLAKKPTWEPPGSFHRFITLVRQAITTSRYKDLYRDLDPRDLQGILRVKSHRCLRGGELDLEKVVDVGSYAGLLFMRMTPEQGDPGVVVRKTGEVVDVSSPTRIEQVNKPAPPPLPPPPPPRTSNDNCLKGARCPKCKSLGPFRINVFCQAVVHDDGVNDTTSHDWTDASHCICLECGFAASYRRFRERKKK